MILLSDWLMVTMVAQALGILRNLILTWDNYDGALPEEPSMYLVPRKPVVYHRYTYPSEHFDAILTLFVGCLVFNLGAYLLFWA